MKRTINQKFDNKKWNISYFLVMKLKAISKQKCQYIWTCFVDFYLDPAELYGRLYGVMIDEGWVRL